MRARYVIGADGANSFVREASGIGFEDQGFAAQWLVIDLLPNDVDALSYIPAPCQWCDPARPHMHTRNGRRHRRFEFMLLPGECPEDFADPRRVWELLKPWMTPEDGLIIRSAVYEFRGRLAQTMRAGRALLGRAFQRAAELGVPTYLDTANPANLPYYGSHGFEMIGQTMMPRGAPLWFMYRA